MKIQKPLTAIRRERQTLDQCRSCAVTPQTPDRRPSLRRKTWPAVCQFGHFPRQRPLGGPPSSLAHTPDLNRRCDIAVVVFSLSLFSVIAQDKAIQIYPAN